MAKLVMSELEEMIVEDMREWVSAKVLDGTDMFEYLSDIEHQEGEEAYLNKLKDFASNYWSNHLGL